MRALMCVSNLPYAASTIKFGGMVLAVLKAEVKLMTVRSVSEDPQIGETVLEQAAELLPVKPIAMSIRRGSPRDEIMKELKSQEYELVVVGTSGHQTLGDYFWGFIAKRLVAQTNISVLVVRDPNPQLRRLLIASAGQIESEPTVKVGVKLAKSAGAEVTLLHVTGAWPGMYTGLERIEETMSEFLQSDTPIVRNLKTNMDLLQAQGVEASLELRHGLPADEIIRSVKRTDFDLIVIGGSRHDVLNRFLLNEVALQIVDQAPRPVLIVQGKTEGLLGSM